MARRRSSNQDSLELLLDTICNTFGGVLFIAILVVLLLQQTGKAPASAQPASIRLSAVEMQTLTARIASVADELDRLRQNRDSQDALVRSFAPEEVKELLTTRSELTRQQESLESEIDRLLASNTRLAAQIENIEVENDDVRERHERARTRLITAKTRLEEDRKSRTREIRMPVVRDSGAKSEIALILRYGRLYVLHQYEKYGGRRGLNTDDFVVVAEKSDRLVVHPNPIAGVPLEDTQASREAIRNALRRFNAKEDYLAIVVRPDSYGAFQYLRDQAIELNFEYRLMPASSDDPFADRGGTGGPVQ